MAACSTHKIVRLGGTVLACCAQTGRWQVNGVAGKLLTRVGRPRTNPQLAADGRLQ
jgi:starvation-inducible outer membrane lipoprotein